MAFSKPMLPDNISTALENALIQQWEAGYRDGVESCAIMVDIMANSVVGKAYPEVSDVLQNLSKNLREQVKNA